MQHISSFGRQLLTSLLILFLLIFGCVAIAMAKIQLDAVDQVRMNQDNPHLIPNHINQRLYNLSEEVPSIRFENNKSDTDDDSTLHSIAFRDQVNLSSQPILDYTTGTSN